MTTALERPPAPPTHRPSLSALVVYLRPAPRARLLLALAELGVFVVEHQGAEQALQTAYATRTDFIVAVADDDPEHAALARRLVGALASVLAVVLPAGADPARLLAAGARVVATDDLPEAEMAACLATAAREARRLRRLGEAAAEWVIFHDIRFRRSPPRLIRRGQTLPLTRVEGEVLAALAGSAGRPVAREELEGRIARISLRPQIQTDGYVKAVVRRLRRKVEALGGDPEALQNVRGVGYLLAA